MNCLSEVLLLLEDKGKVAPQYKPHKLKGKLKGCWECHIKPDWLLIWRLDPKLKEIVLI
jgi:mRNA interferase YafQ